MESIEGFPYFVKMQNNSLVNLDHVAQFKVEKRNTGPNTIAWALVAVVPGCADDGGAVRPVLRSFPSQQAAKFGLDSLLLMLRNTGNVVELML